MKSMGKITAIKTVEDETFSGVTDDRIPMSGYRITTSDDIEILLLIESETWCCESWGYLMSEDETSRFVGAKLYDVISVDEAFYSKSLRNIPKADAGGTVFINLETSIGVLQFVAYNAHNGNYGHTVYKKVGSIEEVKEL